jgi:leader peptidase (prepilin peptidase)/N-methyltransferase
VDAVTVATLAGSAAIGAVGGSAVATAALRAARNEAWLSGRSHCDGCGQELGFARTVPLISYAAARGRCAGCRALIAPSHPMGEAAGLAVVLSAAVTRSDWTFAPCAALGLVLVYAAVFDAETLTIPDWASVAVATLGLVLALAAGRLGAGVATGVGVFATLQILRGAYGLVRKRQGLGGGDVKLLAATSIWLGVERAGVALGLAALLAFLWVLARRGAGSDRIAFAPFIAVGCWVGGIWPSP